MERFGTALRRGPGERVAAWLVTGPAGHTWSAVADLTVLWGRYGWARARGRDPFGSEALDEEAERRP